MCIVTPVPELLDKLLEIRLYVGEQIAAGKMTFEQANKIIAEEKARLIAEENESYNSGSEPPHSLCDLFSGRRYTSHLRNHLSSCSSRSLWIPALRCASGSAPG